MIKGGAVFLFRLGFFCCFVFEFFSVLTIPLLIQLSREVGIQ